MYVTLLVLVVIIGALCRAPSKDVLTTQGVVRGYLVDHPLGSYYAYRAILYARARHHRFKAPKPAKPWDGIFEATYQVKCPQPDGSGTEDCLVVNVFCPEQAAAQPVLVIVHDGDFHSGWGAFQPPTRLLAQNFVIVTFNYRLGALGFLCLGTPEAPGNAGLKDQVAALYWVQKNIANFGGNPLDVTAYGIGSGAASVQLILLSGAARGLLHKAILESGSALSPLSLSYDPMSTAFDAAVVMGYTGQKNAVDLAKYYKELTVESLVKTSTIFLPCLEASLYATHSLLELDPVVTYQQRNHQAVPMIIAYSNMLGVSRTGKVTNANLPASFDNLLPNNLEFENNNTKHRVASVVKEFYLEKYSLNENPIQDYIEYFNDVTFEYPIIKSAVLHAAASSLPTYLMKFFANNETRSISGQSKCCETIFDYFNYDQDGNAGVQTTIQRLVILWRNFIRIGDPTPLTTMLVPVLWQPVKAVGCKIDEASISGLIIDKILHMTDNLANERMLFWDQVHKKFYKKHHIFF